MQKILITGANGHLGANLVRALIADGADVRVLLRPESDNSPTDDLDVERVFGDLRDAASLEAATTGCHAVYHCAAQLSTASGGEQEIFASNVLGTRNLLNAARRNGIGRVVVTGSLSATGHRLDGPADESVPFNPFERHLPYSVSKAAVEHECLKAFAEGLDVVVAVSCAILGSNDFKPSRMGQVLIDHALGRLRTYIIYPADLSLSPRVTSSKVIGCAWGGGARVRNIFSAPRRGRPIGSRRTAAARSAI